MHKPAFLASFAGAVFFSAAAAANPIVIDLVPGTQSHAFEDMTSDGKTGFLFTGNSGTMHLYRTDGRASGTALVDSIPITGGQPPIFLGASAKGAWFVDGASQLWLHRGWKGGGVALGKAPSRKGRLVGELPNGSAFFTFDTIATRPLFVSDGTAQGSSETTEQPTTGNAVATLGSHVYFTETPSHSVVKTDGTTRSVLFTPDAAETPSRLVPCMNNLFIVVSAAGGQSLYVTDGSKQPTLLASPPGLETSLFRCADTKLFFAGKTTASGREVWVTDGTTSGTRLTKDVNPGSSSAIDSTADWELSVVAGRLFFTANDGTNGREPWTTDGTEAGTIKLAEITPGPNGPQCMWKTTRGAGTKAYCMIFVDGEPYRIFEAEGTTLTERSATFHAADIEMTFGNDDFLALGDRLLLEGGKKNVSGIAELAVVDSTSPLVANGGVFPPTGNANPPPDAGAKPDGGGATAADAGPTEEEGPTDEGGGSEEPIPVRFPSNGCSCHLTGGDGSPPGSAGWFAGVVFALLAAFRRRSRA